MVFGCQVVHFAMERDSAFTLSRVVDMDVGTHLTALQEISDSASREYGLVRGLSWVFTSSSGADIDRNR